MGKQAIANKLNEAGIKTRRGTIWHPEPVMRILQNEKYVGDMLLQKSFRENHLSKRKIYNEGQLPMYLVQESHEAIIDKSTFEAVQSEIQRRAALSKQNPTVTDYPFTGKIVCGCCGKNYRRKMNNAGTKYAKPVWICSTFNQRGKQHCSDSKQIPEDTLFALTAEVLGLKAFDSTIFMHQIDSMVVSLPNEVTYRFKDGHDVTAVWSNRSRSDSWTTEMRNEVGSKTKARFEKCRQQQEM